LQLIWKQNNGFMPALKPIQAKKHKPWAVVSPFFSLRLR
jgi:hypothetical protein